MRLSFSTKIVYALCILRAIVTLAQTTTNTTSSQTVATNTTFTTINSYIPPGLSSIRAYASNNTFLYSVNATNLKNYDTAHYPLLNEVGYLMIGTGPTEIGFYSPYGGPGTVTILAAIMLAMNDFVVLGRDPTSKKDTTSIRLIVGDWQHDYTTFCQENNYPSPDIVVVGTTAISATAAKGEILPLDKHLDEYTQQHNTLLVDSFLKYTLYDYYYTNSWWAVPLTTDTRLLFYNRTTFRTLNMTMPPPEGDWGVQYWNNWNWTTFVNYATKIRNSGIGYGYQFYGEYDEESKLITMVARSNILDLFPTNRQCNLLSPIFNDILDNFIRPLWTPTDVGGKFPTVANPDFFATDGNPALAQWLAEPYTNEPPADLSIFTGQYGNGSIIGMNIDSPANTKYSGTWMNDTLTGGNTTESSEIGIGYVPSSASFLGGSGLALASTSNNTETAWNLIVQMIDPEQVYLNIINQATGLYPPYDTSASYPPWSSAPFTVAREQVSHAVPMQYPHITFPQIADFENSHVFRQLLLNVVQKNATNSQAIDEACSVMMEILAPECNSSNWYPVYGDSCQAGTQNLIVSYEWTNSSGIACKGPSTLPSPIYVPCAYAVIDTRQSIAMLTLTSLCAIISLVYAVLLYVYRRTAVVKRASFMFCELVLFGSLFIYSTVYFLAGPATTAKCELVILVVVIGFALLFGSLFCKILRVYKIFNNKGFVALRLTDWYLLKRLAAILVVEAIGLIVLARVDGGPQAVMYDTYTEPQTGQSIMQAKCVYGNIGALIYIAVFNLLLIVYAVALSIATWKVPTQYNESKFVIAASYAVGFGAILLAPLIFFVTDPTARLMIIGLTIDFGVVISVSIFCVPKIYTAIQLYRQETIRRRPGDTLDRIRSRKNCTCGEKHSWWKFWRHDSDSCSSQGSGPFKPKTKPTVSQFTKRKSFVQNMEEKNPESHLSSRRTVQRGNIGYVNEEDVVRSTTVNSFIVDNHKDVSNLQSDDPQAGQDNELVLLNRPVHSLSRRSLNEQRLASNSASPHLHRRNVPPAPYTTFSPLLEQQIAHCPHCGIGFDARSI